MLELSIIICTYNREKFLGVALESLAHQHLKKEKYEIIVINNNSTDSTEEICKNFEKKHPELNFVYAIEQKQGLSFARNKGINLAKGNYIAYIDDDGVAEKNYAEQILNAFKKYPDFTALGGKVLPIYPTGKEPDWMSKYIQGIVSKVDYGETFHEFYKKKYPVGCNMAFRRNFFKQFGGFNTDLTIRSDDKYIFYKLRKNNKKILYAPDIIVHHNIDAFRLTPGFIKRQSLQIGFGEKMRLRNKGFWVNSQKLAEYVFKLFASLVLGLKFLIQKKPAKAKYIIRIMWFIPVGYFKKKDIK